MPDRTGSGLPALRPGEVRNRHGERIAYDWVEGRPGARDVVVIGHGVTSDKDRPWSRALSAALAEHGVASMRIAFSGNGHSGGRYEDSNISKEVEDLQAVMDALPGWRVSYAGHSMGGAVGVLCAARDPRVHALVSLAGMVHTGEFVRRVLGDLRPGELMLGKPGRVMSHAFREDLESIDTVLELGAALAMPWLLVHGTADDVVPIQHSLDIRAAALSRPRLVPLEGVDHSFTGGGIAAMTAAVVPWLLEHLS